MNKVFIIFKYVIIICIFAVSTNTYSQKVYSGNSSYQSDIFCTVSNGYIYIGNDRNNNVNKYMMTDGLCVPYLSSSEMKRKYKNHKLSVDKLNALN